jgi:hypothetical protein
MNELDAFPFRVGVWTRDDQHVDELMAVARNVLVAQAAYGACLKVRRGRLVRLRIKARIIENDSALMLNRTLLPQNCRIIEKPLP